MFTVNEITNNFSYIQSIFGGLENYHSTVNFPHQKHFCDVFFNSKSKIVTQNQVDRFNTFFQNHNNYFTQINDFIVENLNHSEKNIVQRISNANLEFEVIEIPQTKSKYDFVLVCAKYYKRFFMKKSIVLRIEFNHQMIYSMKRTKKTTEDNLP